MKPFVRTINYYETDKMGITHHSNYIRIMEEARIYFLTNIGWPFHKMEETGISSPVIALDVEFKSPTTFADEIKVYVGVEKFSGLKMVISYTMKMNDKVVFKGTSTHAFFDLNGRPIFVEKQYPDFYKALTETKVED